MLKIVDVSGWNTITDYALLKKNVSGILIKSSQGILEDTSFRNKLAGAQGVGLRAGRDANNKLGFWLDVKKMLGKNTGYLLHDGANANLEVTKATVEGEIWNRVIGLASKGASGSELVTEAHIDLVSQARYRMRSRVVQISAAANLAELVVNGKNGSSSDYRLEITYILAKQADY